MKTQKKKVFNLNKLRIAELKQTDFVKGGTKGEFLTNEDVSDCRVPSL